MTKLVAVLLICGVGCWGYAQPPIVKETKAPPVAQQQCPANCCPHCKCPLDNCRRGAVGSCGVMRCITDKQIAISDVCQHDWYGHHESMVIISGTPDGPTLKAVLDTYKEAINGRHVVLKALRKPAP